MTPRDVSEPFAGGCTCGAVRYSTAHAPVFQNHCQCRHCQKRSGTGHGSYLTFPARSAMQVSGATSTWKVTGDLGSVKSHAFCPVCGVPVFLTFDTMPDLIAVHAASLDDPERFVPQIVTFRASAPAWDVMDPQLPAADRMPAP